MNRNETTVELQGDATIMISRHFNAPPDVVFKAWTDPELVKRWWAPQAQGVSMVSCDADLRVGGRFRYVLLNPDGSTLAFSGEYREIEAAQRLLYTQVFEPMEDAGSALIEVSFTQAGRQTAVVSRETYPSAEVREMVLASGMEEGMRQTMEQLDRLVSSLTS